VIPQIGGIKVKELTADHLDEWLDERAEELSTRSLRLIHQIVERAIRQAQARDKVRRNVASLVDVPEGQEGHPSKAMTLGQAVALLETVESGTHRLAAYVALSLLAGVRTEEARAITWDEVAIELIILFLRALFDWGGIRDATVLIKRMLHSAGGILGQELSKAQNILHSAFGDLNSLIGVDASAPTSCTMDLVAGAGSAGTPEGLSLSNGVQAKALFHKLQDNADVSSVTRPAGGSQPAGA
jgi:integrase